MGTASHVTVGGMPAPNEELTPQARKAIGGPFTGFFVDNSEVRR